MQSNNKIKHFFSLFLILAAVLCITSVVKAQDTTSSDSSGDTTDSLISITYPTSDSSWSVGKSNYIRWQSDSTISKVNITLTNIDSGDETTLKNGVSASRGYYLWNISKTLEPGSYTVTVTDAADDSNTATSDPFTLTVKVSSIKISSPSTKVSLSSTLQLDVTVSPDNASDPTITWTVKNGTGKATIDDAGLLTPTKVGTVTVTATANDGSKVKSTKTITITKATTPVTTNPVTTNPATSCTPNWIYTAWGNCVNGSQTRTVVDVNSCGINTDKPADTQACASTCTDFTYSNWSDCINGSQTRTIITSTPAGCTGGSPATLSQTCSTKCSSPSACVNGKQTVTCGGSPYSYDCLGIKLLWPVGGEKIMKGHTYLIKWDASGAAPDEKISIALDRDFGTNSKARIVNIANNIPASLGQYAWVIGPDRDSSPAAGVSWQIEISYLHTSGQMGSGVTEQTIGMTNSILKNSPWSSLNDSVTLKDGTTLNNGSVLSGDFTATDNLTNNGNPSQTPYLISPHTCADFQLNPAFNSWLDPNKSGSCPSRGADKICFSNVSSSGVGIDKAHPCGRSYLNDCTDVTFNPFADQNMWCDATNNPTIPQPTISVTSPNAGGTVWKRGETHQITWSSTGYNANAQVKIAALIYHQIPSTEEQVEIVKDINNSGTYSWTIPTSFDPGDIHSATPVSIRIFVKKPDTSYYTDSSYLSIPFVLYP